MAKSIALFDIDNTMYDGFSYFDLLEQQATEGLINEQVLKGARVSMKKYKSKHQDYETTIVELLDIYAVGLQGARYDDILQSTQDFYARSQKFFPYVEPTIQILRRTHDLVIVTGEPQTVGLAVKERFGMQSYHSTEYEVRNGKFTGIVISYLASRHEKHEAIRRLMHGRMNSSFAFGDSDGDIEMLRAVDYPICLNPTDAMCLVARNEKWYTPGLEGVTALVRDLKLHSMRSENV
jgi:HAD superfamily hydrolase (TIGR01490 family)